MDHFVVLPRRMKTGSLPAVGGLQAEDGPGSPGVAVAADELEGVCRPSCPRAFERPGARPRCAQPSTWPARDLQTAG
jgi:hypothetical protein